MIRLALPSHLGSLIARDLEDVGRRPAIIRLLAHSWPDVVSEIRQHHPRLADRVLDDTGDIKPGFALVVNDSVIPDTRPDVDFADGDEVALVAVMAGGNRVAQAVVGTTACPR